MKSNKVLLGLYAGLLTLAGGVVNAQSTFHEIGPSNIGGHISSLIVDRQDTSRNTLYAGAATGGLFLKTSSSDILSNLYDHLPVNDSVNAVLSNRYDIWHHVPYTVSGKEVVLPISCMAQGPDNTIFIGTGSDSYTIGSNYNKMSRLGMGLYRYVPEDNEFFLIPSTAVSSTDTNFRSINDMEVFFRDGKYYLYVATNTGLYRWVQVLGAENWTLPPAQVFTGRVDDIAIAHRHKTAFFSSGNQLFRIGDVAPEVGTPSPVNISSSNAAFGGNNAKIKLAVSQTDTTFVYAMVIKQNGMLDAVYLSMNEQTWRPITTSTVVPMTYTSGLTSGDIAVDPSNPRRVILAGTQVILGEGYSDAAYYIWTPVSASEYELNYGQYMATVYGNASFVHSGIQQILPVYHADETGDYHTVYFATEGGVFSSRYMGHAGFGGFSSENNGLNTLQVNGLAVAPDGTILIGANANSCPIIEARLDHFGRQVSSSWFDYANDLNINHEANVLWTGNGGAVAISAFQQVTPLSRRTIFTSSENGNIGRSYADYLDYTNITTWTSGQGFRTDLLYSGPTIGSIYLWETDTNTVFNGSVNMGIDTLGYIFRLQGGVYDTLWVNAESNGANRGRNLPIKAKDKAVFYSRGHADYPFEYVFTNADLTVTTATGATRARVAGDTITVRNPIQSRMVTIADHNPDLTGFSNIRGVFYNWTPSEFSKVWNEQDGAMAPNDHTVSNQLMQWADIYHIDRTVHPNIYPRQAVISANGKSVFISVFDVANNRSMLVRVSGFEKADYNTTNIDIANVFKYGRLNPILSYDTLSNNGDIWFPRPISNIAVAPASKGDKLILTFDNYSSSMANVAIVNNACDSLGYSITAVPLPNAEMPAYCAIVEDSLGTIYVGAEDGVYTRESNASAWTPYANLTGVPVTAIVQQTGKLPIRHNLTHTSINANNYAFAKTKWSRAIYFGTYGRGVFMDTKYVTDFSNEVVDSVDYTPVAIPTVHTIGLNSVKLSPNPVYDEATLSVNANVAGKGIIRVYDLNGRLVMDRNMGFVPEGEQVYTLDCTGMNKGMYLINVIISGHTATTKMIVR